ncbi:MAG TPA: type II secretion system F family protein, partial [Gemmatimonadaceae bacterium]|nr:type II secretion system F family protein [Gemmatimonadaceae bacterium]
VTAVLIQRESGGNLSEVLGNIGKVVRERLALRGEIATLTSQGKLSARIMAGLPLFVFVAVRVMDPAYMNEMTSKPLGRLVLLGAAASVMVGYLTMMRIADVEV